MIPQLAISLAICLLASCRTAPVFANSLLAGDIVFQDSGSPQCEAVKLATASTWSHCGIVLPHQGELMVLEAVQPVQWASIAEWKARGIGKKIEVRRLRSRALLTESKIAAMVLLGEKFVGKNYDGQFSWSDEDIYCSELVWKLYQRTTGLKLGALRPMRDFQLRHAEVQAIIKQRYGSSPPLSEPIMSQEDLRLAPELVEVAFPAPR